MPKAPRKREWEPINWFRMSDDEKQAYVEAKRLQELIFDLLQKENADPILSVCALGMGIGLISNALGLPEEVWEYARLALRKPLWSVEMPGPRSS